MKRILTFAVSALVVSAAISSCVGGQQPSKRVAIWDDAEDSTAQVSLSANRVIVPFQRTDGNLAQVQVSMNGVPFNMWWDTGASMTCISALELEKLAKEGKIELDDYQGSAVTRFAVGSRTESLVFNIKEIYIQGRDNQYLTVHNVSALVSQNTAAPLLIGQNVIQQLPRHVFNEADGVIEFERQ